MKRTLFGPDHEAFRSTLRDFLAREVVPVFPKWLEQELVPPEFFRALAELGVMGLNIPEEYGGSGPADFGYSVILSEEAAKALVHLGPLRSHMDVVMPYLLAYCDDEQRKRCFPGLAAGDVTAIAMTEPGTGSDLAGIRTSAVRDGDHYVLNGAKTFITGGIIAELVVVVARTSTDPENRRGGLTLLVADNVPARTVQAREQHV